MKGLYLALLFLVVLHDSRSFSGEPMCAFTQFCVREQGQSITDPCPDAKNTYTPYENRAPPKLPQNSRKYLIDACPNMVDQEVCCNDDQILVMYNNFKTIDSLFGNCLICSINLKRFWCQYTCSPYQYYFVDVFDQIHVPDVDYLCLNQTMRIGNEVACDIFNS